MSRYVKESVLWRVWKYTLPGLLFGTDLQVAWDITQGPSGSHGTWTD